MSSPRKQKKFLTDQEKDKMMLEYRTTKISQRDLAQKWSVSKTYVQRLVKEEKSECDDSDSSLKNFDSLIWPDFSMTKLMTLQ